MTLGFDATLALPSLFARVEDLAWATDGRVIDKEARIGDTPETGQVVQLGGSNPPLCDLGMLVSALAPYVQVPVSVQLRLLWERDTCKPLSFTALCRDLAAICSQTSHARLALCPPAKERVFLVLNEQGWQMHSWPILESGSIEQAFARLLFPDQDMTLEVEDVHVRTDPSIVLRFHDDNPDLPIFTISARGLALSGPVAISNETRGLTAEQVSLIAQEVFFVEEAIRYQVTRIWRHAWNTLAARGW
jgi:hypothetical protein